MTVRVLVTAPYFQPVAHRFAATFAGHEIEPILPPIRERLSEAELLPLVPEIVGAICGDDAFTETVLAHAPKLRVISKWGTGIDSIDLEACRRRGIVVCNTPDAFSQPVADSTLGYMLGFVRQLHLLSSDVNAGHWRKRPARSLGECTVGLVGVGDIGKAVARRLVGFGCRVLGADPVTPPDSFLEACRVEMVARPVLLRESDIVSLHCTLNPTSLRLINAAALELMRPTAFLINTARGRVIDEAALVEALRRGRLAGAALDVFEEEPLPTENPLRLMPNVFLAPHNANSSPRAWEYVHEQTVDHLIQNLCRPAAALTTDALA